MNRYMDITPTNASSGSNAGAWIFLIIFFGIIIALVIVAIIGSRKDKIEKLVENDKRRKIRTQATADRVALFSTLNTIIVDLNKELKDFKPSVGMRSLGDINKEASDKIKEIVKSDVLKGIYLSEDFKNEIKPVLDELSKHKPSNWSKEASFATGLVEAKFKALSKKEENKEDIKRGKKLEWK